MDFGEVNNEKRIGRETLINREAKTYKLRYNARLNYVANCNLLFYSVSKYNIL